MRYIFLLGYLLLSLTGVSQPKADSIQQIKEWLKWYDLDFSSVETDSMLGELRDFSELYKKMHSRLPANNIPYPLSFQPAPYGFVIPQKQQKIDWNIPKNVTLPGNKNELAFYSIPQLASLIKNKKISSVELTKFFIDRLKKWGDTLECVVTLTEELALKEAQQADTDLKNGIYRGPLHGIPYGLKDLFAVKGYKTPSGSTLY